VPQLLACASGGQRVNDTRLYLRSVFGDDRGTAFVAIGSGPHLSDKGKYQHKSRVEIPFDWPSEADLVEREILRAAIDSDVYICPYLMRGKTRTKGAAVSHRLAHADVDNGLADPEKVRAINGFAVSSGSPNNAHVYVTLTESVPLLWHEALCRGLGRHCGAIDAKISDNDILRPPGTLNHKPTVTGADPVAVEWLVRP
jgi:hypothetical protein